MTTVHTVANPGASHKSKRQIADPIYARPLWNARLGNPLLTDSLIALRDGGPTSGQRMPIPYPRYPRRRSSRRWSRISRRSFGGLPFVQVSPAVPWKGVALMSSRIRVVVAKPGLDGHDRGAKVVARALRDAGMEVIYTGLHQTPEQIVETAIQEDADAVGLSVLSGAHMTLFRRVLELLAERDARDMVVFGGGIIPDADIPELERLGVAKIFTPGATTQSIVDWVRDNVAQPVA